MIKVEKYADIHYILTSENWSAIFNDEERKQLIDDLKAIGKKIKVPFISNYEEYRLLASNKRKSMRIIAQYAAEKNIHFYSKAQVAEFVSRNVKAATVLEGYPGKKIHQTMDYLKKNVDFKWTLESVVKYAEELDNLDKGSNKKALGEFIM